MIEDKKEKLKLKVKYHNDNDRLEFINGNSDWIDLRAAKDIVMKKGDFMYIPLGVSIELPSGYEAHVAPRSSTFKNFGLIQVNSVGVIDESFCGDDNEWRLPALATRDIEIKKNSRICQFRIMRKMQNISIEAVDTLGNKNRGDSGSSGIK